MVKYEILDKLRSHQWEIAEKFHAQIKGIFGSWVRNQQNSQSDLDILVEFDHQADFLDYVALSNFLEEQLQNPVDLVPVSSLREELKDHILNEAVFL